MPHKTHSFTVGALSCTLINDGTVTRGAADLFPSILKEARESTLLQAGVDPDALTLAYHPLLVQGAEQTVLVDTGLGQASVPGAGQLREALATLDVQPADIDTIILTHGHPDHIGGLSFFEGGLAFPNARYLMRDVEWQRWGTDDALNTLPRERREFYIETLQRIADVVELFDAEPRFAPGITALRAPGHTVGHTALLVESGSDALLHIADAAHHPIQFAHPDWSPVVDEDGAQAAETRRALFQRAADDDLLLSAYHFAFPPLGRVQPDGDAFRWEPVSRP